MKEKKKRTDFEDDGRTVANMNVDGMPWYSPTRTDDTKPELTPSEKKAVLGGVVKAVLIVSGVFALAFTLFILFCVLIWFR